MDCNGLDTNDPTMIAFLTQEYGSTRTATRAVAPDHIGGTDVSDHSVWLD